MDFRADNIRRKKNQSGLTLVELAIAMIVVAISVLAYYQMFITGNMLMTEQYHRRLVMEKAQGWMERMKYNQNELGIVPMSFQRSFSDVIVSDSEHEAVVAECRISVEYSSQRNPNSNVPYYSDVIVLYEWEELSEREYRVELRSRF